MPWSVRLQDECGKPVINSDAVIEFALLEDVRRDGLLRYIDPYGDTIFNNLQMADFIAEWKTVEPRHLDQKKEWQQVLEMASQCEQAAHIYLRFIGD